MLSFVPGSTLLVKCQYHFVWTVVFQKQEVCVFDLYSFLFIYYFFFFNFTILYWFCHTSTCICHRCTRVTHPETPPPRSLYHPSGSSQYTRPKLPVSCIKPELEIHFLYDIIHVLMPFSKIIPPPSPTGSKRLFYTSVSLSLSCHR